jgi:hypothetical protein
MFRRNILPASLGQKQGYTVHSSKKSNTAFDADHPTLNSMEISI